MPNNPLLHRADRVRALRTGIFTIAEMIAPVVDLARIYVDGLDALPRDGRFLLVGNHTMAGWPEIVLIPYFVHRELGVRVRGLAARQMADVGGVAREVLEAAGAVIGDPATGAELMRRDETVLVFPGGGRDMLKFKGEEYKLLWQGRSGFARLAIAHDYPIVPVGLVGGDDVYRSVAERGGRWERMTRRLGERLHGLADIGVPIFHGVGPTLVPRPQRMYLEFGFPDRDDTTGGHAGRRVGSHGQATDAVRPRRDARQPSVTTRNRSVPPPQSAGLGQCRPSRACRPTAGQ